METIFDKASENAPEVGLDDDEGSLFIAIEYHLPLQLPGILIWLVKPVYAGSTFDAMIPLSSSACFVPQCRKH
jgi:hypothetical protein